MTQCLWGEGGTRQCARGGLIETLMGREHERASERRECHVWAEEREREFAQRRAQQKQDPVGREGKSDARGGTALRLVGDSAGVMAAVI